MDMMDYLLYFLVGGSIVTIAVLLSKIGHPLLSGIAMMFPSITFVSFYFINKTVGKTAVLISAKSALVSAFIVWAPYALTFIYFVPRVGVNKALAISMVVFLIMGFIWFNINQTYRIVK